MIFILNEIFITFSLLIFFLIIFIKKQLTQLEKYNKF